MKDKKNGFIILLNILGVLIGISMLVAGILLMVFATEVGFGFYGLNASFGADFYTYINNNADRIVDNTGDIVELLQYLKDIVSHILSFSGLLTTIHFLKSLINSCNIKNEKITLEANYNGKKDFNQFRYDELFKLKKLLDNGIITEEEFEENKKNFIG